MGTAFDVFSYVFTYQKYFFFFLMKYFQENVDLLKEQILNLTAERDRAETRAKDKVVLQADIQTLR